MDFTAYHTFSKRGKAQLLVLPYWKKEKKVVPASDFKFKNSAIDTALQSGDFLGKEGDLLFLYTHDFPEPRVVLLGLGEGKEFTIEKLRRAYHRIARACQAKKIKTLTTFLPEHAEINPEQMFSGLAEGLLLTNYAFEKHKSKKEDHTVLLTSLGVISPPKDAKALFNDHLKISEAVYRTRDLVNDNADEITPAYIAHAAQALAKKLPYVKATVFDKKRIEKEKMGLLLAVNRGSDHDPVFIIIEYLGNPKSKDRTLLVGKGITYDTGGLNLKPTGSMETMRCDMAGAATVLGIIEAAATTGLKQNLVGVIASTENCIDARSYKPGDIYRSYSGKTVEISNTDAEGRLVLADALAYAVDHLKPTRMFNFATLTGAMVVALGEETTGFMTNDASIGAKLTEAGLKTYERVWQLPLFDEYKEALKSDFADLKNAGSRMGGAITAAMFLKEFVKDTPWVHLDIAGTAFQSEGKAYRPKNGTGIGVRLMMEFLRNL